MWEKYTLTQLRELARKYNHIVRIKYITKLKRNELESEMSKHLEVHTDAKGKDTINIKSKTEIWRTKKDTGEEEAKRVYEKVKQDVIDGRGGKKEGEKKKKDGKTSKDKETTEYGKPVKRRPSKPKKE
jgi:predicted Rdx family selenoprotein